jgi:hypothetical protein
MFGPKHYVPILRWKRGERFALMELNAETRRFVTPLIEVTPKMFEAPKKGKNQGVVPDPAKVLFETSKQVLKSWGYEEFFVDFWHMDGRQVGKINGKHALEYFTSEARAVHLKTIAVTSLARSADYQSAVRQVVETGGGGVCVRVSPEDLTDSKVANKLAALLKDLKADVKKADLLLDCQALEAGAAAMGELLHAIPFSPDWRTVTLASGAFPKDLQDKQPGIHRIARADWLEWRRLVERDDITRKPSFSDYTIQFGRYEEPPSNCNPSASIRYTLPDAWLVLRGEGIMNKKGPGRAQWPAQAVLLCDSEDFYGSQFSAGDDYIYKVRNGTEGHGSPETWIRAGINHHLTVVARQVASLPDF